MLRLLILVAVLIHAAGANAQTAEEAVALAAYGLEPGLATGSLCGDIQAPKVTPGSPAKYRFDCGNGDWFETAIRQIDGCKFETSTTMNGKEPDRRDVLDFSKFRDLLPARENAATMGHFFDAGSDFCTSSDGKSCMMEFISMGSGECCVLSGQVARERVVSTLSLILSDCRQ